MTSENSGRPLDGRNLHLKSLPPFDRRMLLLGAATIAGFLGLLGAWSALAPIESAVVAPGIVSVESNRRTIQHLEGGIVEAILVKEGSRVSAGDVLIRLQDTQRNATRNQLKIQSFETQATVARLIAERDGHEEIRFPDALLQIRSNPAVAAAIDGQIDIFRKRRKYAAERTGALDRHIASLSDEIAGLTTQIGSTRHQLALVDEELKGLENLYAKNLVGKPRMLAVKRSRAELGGRIGRFTSEIARANQAIEETRLRIAEMKSERSAKIAELLRSAEERAYGLSQQLAAAEDVLDRTEIRSPIDGMVVGLKVHTNGGVIAAGAPLLDIVPLDDRLVVHASIDPEDVDQVMEGMAARIQLTALNRRTRTPIGGKVAKISADRLTDPRTGFNYYLAQVEFSNQTGEPAHVRIQPGMGAEVLISTGARSPLDYLLAPISRSMNRALREN
jgi:epimerase transport system membrane fusion protein